jgi:hypothetical protein
MTSSTRPQAGAVDRLRLLIIGAGQASRAQSHAGSDGVAIAAPCWLATPSDSRNWPAKWPAEVRPGLQRVLDAITALPC